MKKAITIVLSFMLVMSMLLQVACGTKEDTTKTEAVTTSAVTTSAATMEPVTLKVVMNTDYYKAGIAEVIKNLTKDTGITLEIEKTPAGAQGDVIDQTKFATGDVPDLLFYYASETFLRKLGVENFIEQTGQPWMENFDATIWKAAMTVDGKYYAAPYWGQNVAGMLYNKKVFEKAGITTTPQNYAELDAACAKIRAVNVDPIFYSGKDGWSNMIYSYCTGTQGLTFDTITKLNTNKAKFVDFENVIGGLTQQVELMKKGYTNKSVLSATVDQAEKALATGTAAMYCMGTWAMADINAKYHDQVNDIGFFPVPYIGGGEDVVSSFNPNALYVVKGPKQADAQRFVNYFESVPVQNTYFSVEGGLPTIKGVTKTSLTPAELEAKTYVDKGKSALVWNVGFKYASGDYGAACQDVLAGAKTPLQAMETCDREFQKSAKAAADPNFK